MGVTLEQEMLALSRISVKPQIRIPDRANVKHEVNDKTKLNFGLSPRIFNERFGNHTKDFDHRPQRKC